MAALVTSKAEINLIRLLSRCEEHVASRHGGVQRVSDAKLQSYLAYSEELLSSLLGEGLQTCPASISPEKGVQYKERISKLVAELGPTPAPPDVWQPVLQEEQEVAELSINKPDESADVAEPSLAAMLRRRAGLQNRNSSQNSSDAESTRLDDSSHLLVQKNRLLQEDLTDQMLEFAGRIKANSYLMDTSMQESRKILDNAELALDRNIANTRGANLRAKSVARKSLFTGCITWLVILGLLWIFLGMVLLIRIT